MRFVSDLRAQWQRKTSFLNEIQSIISGEVRGLLHGRLVDLGEAVDESMFALLGRVNGLPAL